MPISLNYKQVITLIFKTAGLLFLAYYLLFRVEWELLIRIIGNIRIPYFTAAVIAFAVKLMLDAWKWHLINNMYGIRLPYITLVKYVIIGPFFSFMTPLPQGEDIYNFYMLKKESGDAAVSVTIPVLMRLTGLVSLSLLLPFSFAWYMEKLSSPATMALVLPAIALTGIFFSWLLRGKLLELSGRTGQFFTAVFAQAGVLKELLRTRTGSFVATIGINLLSQCAYAFFIWFLVSAFSIDLSFPPVLLFIPFVYFGTLLPVSAGGIGIKEGLWVWMLSVCGFNPAVSQALGAVHLLIVLLFVLVGFLLYLLSD